MGPALALAATTQHTRQPHASPSAPTPISTGSSVTGCGRDAASLTPNCAREPAPCLACLVAQPGQRLFAPRARAITSNTGGETSPVSAARRTLTRPEPED